MICWRDVGNQVLARLCAALKVSSGEVGIDFAFWHTRYVWEVRWLGCHCRMRSLLWAFPHGTTIYLYPQNLSDMTFWFFRHPLSITINGDQRSTLETLLPGSRESHGHCLISLKVQLKPLCIFHRHLSIVFLISLAVSSHQGPTHCTS